MRSTASLHVNWMSLKHGKISLLKPFNQLLEPLCIGRGDSCAWDDRPSRHLQDDRTGEFEGWHKPLVSTMGIRHPSELGVAERRRAIIFRLTPTFDSGCTA